MKCAAGDKQPFISWSDKKDKWQCCGDYGCDGVVTGETFDAVSPSKWSAIPSNGDDSSSNGLSTPATAGIAVAAAVVVIAILGLGGWCLLRRRKQSTGRKFNKAAQGQYAKIQPQHEMGPGPYGGRGGSRAASPQPGPSEPLRGTSPTPSPLVPGYSGQPPNNLAAQSASMYPDQLAAQRSTISD